MFYEGHLDLDVCDCECLCVCVCWSAGSEAPRNPVIKPAATEPNPPLLYPCAISIILPLFRPPSSVFLTTAICI